MPTRRFILAVALLALTLPAAAAQGAVTLGSSLSGPAEAGLGCGPAPTFVQIELPDRPLASPMDGVVTRWRIKYLGGPDPFESYQLRVLRPVVGGQWRGSGTSPHVPFPIHATSPGGITESEVRLPVRAGDMLGLDIGETRDTSVPSISAFDQRTGEPVSLSSFRPKLSDGETRGTGPGCFQNAEFELLMNADVEPDADRDGLGDETQDSDTDGDGLEGSADNCASIANPDQRDSDGDGLGDACEEDADDDGVPSARDNCPSVASPNQADLDGDAQGDACDADDDGDGVNDADEAAIGGDPRRSDTDGDGLGDLADRCPAEAGPGSDGCPGAAEGSPRLRGVPRRMRRAAFLRGVRVSFTSSTRMAAEIELRVPVRSAGASAARLELTLARRSLEFGTGTRRVTLRPRRRLLGRTRRFRAQVRMVAVARDGSRASLSRTTRVRP